MRERVGAGGLLTLLVLVVAAVPPAGAANVDYFLKIDGITGQSTAEGFEGHMPVDSFSWGMTQAGGQASQDPRTRGKVNVRDFSFVKSVDASSPLLMLAAASGKRFTCAVLTGRRTDDGQSSSFLSYTFADVHASSYETAGSAGDAVPSEQFSLTFARVRYEVTPQTQSGASSSTAAGWDFLTREQFSTKSSC